MRERIEALRQSISPTHNGASRLYDEAWNNALKEVLRILDEGKS